MPTTSIASGSCSDMKKVTLCKDQVIKQWKECGIIEPHYPNLTSRLKSLIPKKSQSNVISGLYRMGHGPKSAFWYWKINLKEEYYQEFWAVDLDEGERTAMLDFELSITKHPVRYHRGCWKGAALVIEDIAGSLQPGVDHNNMTGGYLKALSKRAPMPL
ncbi:hypothetical protein P691DRAFT_785082 [Macrolepiota fuliginosa MF-IS2]|uniref:Uncharacterized protein n=1 Tax=Macrolepiota fuliginosa MF-IS2 TaxID=1400762 RepID=A0A9P5XA60_9AGAR|nr:hypothetical protein P691DRAFT_785082 [Macrolepiota fuliginosa MF-IS2]